jgi:hypothetical protein
MLFATQNPAGLYGGRKALSAAFRNRFIELHIDDIPGAELTTILSRRSALPASYVDRMVAVMLELHRHTPLMLILTPQNGRADLVGLWALKRDVILLDRSALSQNDQVLQQHPLPSVFALGRHHIATSEHRGLLRRIRVGDLGSRRIHGERWGVKNILWAAVFNFLVKPGL